MTAYLVFNAIKDKKLSLEQTLPVSVRDWSERKGGGSLMFIDPKMTPKVDELLKGMIAVSGNDAAVALAEGVSGSLDGFIAMMNRQAQAWGLKSTQFKNVTGLNEAGHYSSARDIVAMAAHVIREHPTFYANYYSIRQYTFNHIKQDNRNLLLGREHGADCQGGLEALLHQILAQAGDARKLRGATGWTGDDSGAWNWKKWSFGECAMGFTVCQSDLNRAVISDFGFIHSTSNGGVTWTDIGDSRDFARRLRERAQTRSRTAPSA
jgi:hypothetical protein